MLVLVGNGGEEGKKNIWHNVSSCGEQQKLKQNTALFMITDFILCVIIIFGRYKRHLMKPLIITIITIITIILVITMIIIYKGESVEYPIARYMGSDSASARAEFRSTTPLQFRPKRGEWEGCACHNQKIM